MEGRNGFADVAAPQKQEAQHVRPHPFDVTLGLQEANLHGAAPMEVDAKAPGGTPPAVSGEKKVEEKEIGRSESRSTTLRKEYAAKMRRAADSLRGAPLGRRPAEDVEKLYEIRQKLGEGQFGSTYVAVSKETGKKYACKRVAKSRLISLGSPVLEVRREVAILHHLAGHNNVVSIQGAYEDAKSVNIVMELCSGGELYDRIVAKGHFSERRASRLTKTIVQVVEYCHSLGVVHRDLKPENFLFGGPEEDAPLKTIDFGLSLFFRPGEVLTGLAGSPLYMAYEMVARHPPRYGPEIDVWSAGVILYILLCGYPPFGSASQPPREIFAEIASCDLDLLSFPWPLISANAKELLTGMLQRDPAKRMTAHQVLCHPWVAGGVAPDTPLDPVVLTRLRQFSAANRLKKIATRVIAENMKHEEIAGLREMFRAMDADKSGTITYEELKAGLMKMGAHVTEDEVQRLLDSADVDGDHMIDYGEFFAATLHLSRVEKDENLLAAFMHFDQDGNGTITKDELARVCEELHIEHADIEDMISKADLDNDGQIDYHEFVAMMRAKQEVSGIRSYSIGRNRQELQKLGV